jgi:hypothetical protein
VDAKGDLIAASANDTPARLAVGANGETLVADSSATTGLRYNPTTAAGKNAVINGAMNNWQRGTSFTATGFTADRWYLQTSASANTVSRSTDAPSGFPYSLKWDFAGTSPLIATYIELPITGVKGQYTGTWTVSFWAKGSTTFNMNFEASFNNGSNRVDNVAIGSTQTVAATTTWTKYSYTLDLTSPTINANNKAIQLIFYSSSGTASMYLTGVQFEQGSVATAFTMAGGTIQGELAACQRYYYRANSVSLYGYMSNLITATASSRAIGQLPMKVTMRTTPTAIDYNAVQLSADDATITAVTSVTIMSGATADAPMLSFNVASGLTQFRPYFAAGNNSTSAYIGLSAEL